MYKSKSHEWHLKEQERIANEVFPVSNGGQTVKKEGIGWGRQKRRISKLLKKESRVMEIVKTVTS